MRYITGIIGCLFYFPIKLSIIGDYLLHGFLSLLTVILNRRITPCVVKARYNNRLYMSPSLATLMKYWQYNYFSERRNVTNLAIKDFVTGITNLSSYKGRTLYTQTNSFMYAMMSNPKINPNIAKVEIMVVGKATYFQPLEKAYLIGPLTFLTNILNWNLYKTLFKIEEIYKLEITVK